MNAEEIPREKWGEFLDGYSRRHQGSEVSVSFEPPAGGEGKPIVDHPGTFEKISPDRLRAGDFAIVLKASPGPGQHVLETIHHPTKLLVVRAQDGMDEGLRIESQTGASTVVRFRH